MLENVGKINESVSTLANSVALYLHFVMWVNLVPFSFLFLSLVNLVPDHCILSSCWVSENETDRKIEHSKCNFLILSLFVF